MIFAAFIAFALSGCNAKNAAAPPSAPPPPVFAVSTATVEAGRMTDYLMLSGDMVAGSSVDVYSDVAGTITRRYVSIGANVNKGQPIIDVDPSQPGMQYMASVVRAPISGVVSSLSGQVGMKIAPSAAIAVISGGGGLEIQLYVAERFIYRIKMGLPCEITLDAYPDDSFRGRVSEISPVVNTASRTMMIKVNVDNPDDKLKAGMFANVKIITEEKNDVLYVPENAVLQRANESFVYMVVDNPDGVGTETEADTEAEAGVDADAAVGTAADAKIVKRTVVTTGLAIDGMVEITNGLQAGDQIVTRGQTTLTDGSHVNIIR